MYCKTIHISQSDCVTGMAVLPLLILFELICITKACLCKQTIVTHTGTKGEERITKIRNIGVFVIWISSEFHLDLNIRTSVYFRQLRKITGRAFWSRIQHGRSSSGGLVGSQENNTLGNSNYFLNSNAKMVFSLWLVSIGLHLVPLHRCGCPPF